MQEEKVLYDGYCEFCGQIVQYDDEILSEAKQDKEVAAKLVCDCGSAKSFQWRHRAIDKGIKKIESVVGTGESCIVSKEILSYLKKAIVLIVNRKMRKVTVQISDQEKITISLVKKGIKVSRELKKKDDAEVNLDLL